MGLFDNLFGKKKKEAPQRQEESRQTETAPAGFTNVGGQFLYFGSDKGSISDGRKKYLAKVQDAIRKVPGAEKYFLETQQTNASADFMTITQFTACAKDRFVVFDLETTGIKYQDASIVEIGAVRVENGIITDEYSQLVNPGYPMPAEASSVNHITDDMLAGQPEIYEVLPSFLVFVGEDALVAHNMKFDYQFLANACMQNQFRIPEKLFDTMALARYYPEAGSKKLTALVEAAGLKTETTHRALSDARMTANLVLATIEKRSKKS